jgi:hypothetical protein
VASVQEVLPPHVATHSIDFVYRHLEKYHGIPSHLASDRLHRLKAENGLPANFHLLFHKTGNIYRGDNRMYVGSLTDGGKKSG